MALKLTRSQLAERYSKDERTIDRWTRDATMNFPQPKIIRPGKLVDGRVIGRSLAWDESEIEQWERSLPTLRTAGYAHA
jgi:predicted DNA-binding transcriptional regulator AlpA